VAWLQRGGCTQYTGVRRECGYTIDISQYRLLFGFFLLYTDRVPFELLDSAASIDMNTLDNLNRPSQHISACLLRFLAFLRALRKHLNL
jgi:hypothetical protein